MTTLPQTTNLRLPRPVGMVPMAGHAGMPMPAAMAQQAAPTGMTASDVWRVIRANLWLIIGLFVASIVIGLGTYFYLLWYHPGYTAVGFVQVTARNMTDVWNQMSDNVQDNTSVQIDQRTHAQLLEGYSLHTRVLQDPNAPIRQTTWFKQYLIKQKQPDGSVREVLNDAEAKEDLQDNFSASPIQESRLIQVAMHYNDARDSKVIVDNIVNVHLREQRKIMEERTGERVQTLNSLKNKYELLIRQFQSDANRKLARLNEGGASAVPGFAGSAKDMELQRLVEQQVRLSSIFQEVQSQLQAVEEQIQQGIRPPMVERMVDQDQGVQRLQFSMDEIDMALGGARTAGGSDHRQVRQLEGQREEVMRLLDEKRAEVAVKMQDALLEQLRQQVKTTQSDLDAANKQIQNIKDELADLATTRAEYLTLKDEEETYRQMLEEVSKQYDTITSNNQSISANGLEWAQSPATPDKPSFPNFWVTVSIAVCAGISLSLGIAFLRELLDTSVRSPRDIARVGQMNLLGMIPDEEDDPHAAGTPLPLVIFQSPHSIMAEQFRQVRTRLQHAASLDTTRSILITSPSPEDGKSTVACNLAAGLALNGRRILLVDCNFRRPEIHNIFGTTNEMGFGQVLNDISNFENAVRPTQVPNLDILPSGPKPANATELLESQALVDFVERALEEYDHVLFDTGPLLFVSETVALAPRVDGVVTVVRANSNSRGLLQRMRDSLRQLKAEHLGVVLNGVQSQAGGYYNRNIRTYYEYQNHVPATTTTATTN